MKIHTENLGKKFNREWIFRNLTVEFSSGVWAITGPNGSGKSTLLQVLWGQMPMSQGTIVYTDEHGDVSPTNIYQQLTIATPYMDLVDEFTLEEMIQFHFNFKTPRPGIKTEQIIDLLELDHARHKPIGKFSSGMKQRTKLGLAFFSQASLVFLDEPSTNLDKPSFQWYWKQLLALPADTLVMIASNQEEEYPADCRKLNILDFK